MPEAVYADPYTERIEAQRKLMEEAAARQSARYSPEESSARRAQNQREYQLGLLSMLTGDDSFAPVGQLLTKKSLADRAERVTDQGAYDPLSGSYKLHPEVTRERQERELGRLEDSRAAGQRAFQMARQQAQDRVDAAEAQRQFLAGQGDLNRTAAAAARAGQQDARNWTVEDRMADDYTRDTKNAGTILNAHKQLRSIAQRTDAPSDIAFVYSFMRMLDPSSVVREGEYATAQNAAGVPDRIRNAYNATMTGQRLNPQQRQEMLSVADRLAVQAETGVNETADQYTQKATRRNLNPENVTGRVLKNTLTPAGSGAGSSPSARQPVRVNY